MVRRSDLARGVGRLGVWFSCASLLACGGLKLTKVESAESKPANVYVLFRAANGAEPVAALGPDAFVVTEDGFPVPAGSDRLLVNPDLRASVYTALVLDLSGHPSEPEQEAMAQLASATVDRLGAGKRVAVYALDGAAEPATLVPFGATPEAQKAGARKVADWKPRDASTDLNGGYLSVWRAVKKRMEGADLRAATILLVSRGPDRAARMTTRQVKQETSTPNAGDIVRVSVALGTDATKAELGPFSDEAPVLAPTAEALRQLQPVLVDRLEARARSFYLLSYCSKARAGKHRVRVEATRVVKDEKGREDSQRGSLDHEFAADGFGAGCTPQVPPGWQDPSK